MNPLSGRCAFSASRRRLLRYGLLATGAAALNGGVLYKAGYLGRNFPVQVDYAGLPPGHRLRPSAGQRQHVVAQNFPPPAETVQCGTVIAGSGIAGLFTAWRLQQQGYHDFILVSGPELAGNARGSQLGQLACPTGAHYLPLPGQQLDYIRELLQDMGVLESGLTDLRPVYDERALVHAPESRIWVNGQWQAGSVPQQGLGIAEQQQQARFFQHMAWLAVQTGSDSQPVFNLPVQHSSTDPQWLALDRMSFRDWLHQHGYDAPGLLWYLNYTCRDDYGLDAAETSAWAGLHYFCARNGQAANAAAGAVFTWPDGLATPARHMLARTGSRLWQGMVIHMEETGQQVITDVFLPAQQKTVRLVSRHGVCAMPLHVARHVVRLPVAPTFLTAEFLPHRAWQISNILLNRPPDEVDRRHVLSHQPATQPLAWDNTVYGSNSLGFVSSTHQQIGHGLSGRNVLTAYHAYSEPDEQSTRKRLLAAPAGALLEVALRDLDQVYPAGWQRGIERIGITIRGHGMTGPAVGFRQHAGLRALRNHKGALLFAHSDLSGISVFEEAAYWGNRATRLITD